MNIGDIYMFCQMSVFDLGPINKRSSNKEKNQVRVFFRRSTTLLDDEPRVILISIPQ